jgi:hypothetical protein
VICFLEDDDYIPNAALFNKFQVEFAKNRIKPLIKYIKYFLNVMLKNNMVEFSCQIFEGVGHLYKEVYENLEDFEFLIPKKNITKKKLTKDDPEYYIKEFYEHKQPIYIYCYSLGYLFQIPKGKQYSFGRINVYYRLEIRPNVYNKKKQK